MCFKIHKDAKKKKKEKEEKKMDEIYSNMSLGRLLKKFGQNLEMLRLQNERNKLAPKLLHMF